MQNYSISELARIFKITKYTIRHYVDEGLLSPEKNSVSGYYTFSETDLYRLYQILTFRKIGYAVKDIKKLFEQDNFTDVFRVAEAKVQDQINSLLATKRIIHTIIQAQENTKFDKIAFAERDGRFFKQVPDNLLAEEQLNLLEIAKFDSYQPENVCYLIKSNGNYDTCFLGKSDDYHYVMPKGDYAYKNVLIQEEQELYNQIESFKNDSFIKNALSTDNSVILCYENIFSSLAYNQATVFTLEVKL